MHDLSDAAMKQQDAKAIDSLTRNAKSVVENNAKQVMKRPVSTTVSAAKRANTQLAETAAGKEATEQEAKAVTKAKSVLKTAPKLAKPVFQSIWDR